ncbi:MAG: hypothetical protein ACI4JI_09385 [Ruminiclostridium sp.]
MIKAVRIFNSNILFKIAVFMVVLIALFFGTGFALGVAAGENADLSQQAQQAGEDISLETLTVIMSCVLGYISAMKITGSAVNMFYKTDGCKYARTIKNADKLFCSSLVGSQLLSHLTAIALSGVISAIMTLFDCTKALNIPVVILFSLASSLLFDIIIRPLLSTKSGNARFVLILITLFFVSAVVSAAFIVMQALNYRILLISGGILTLAAGIGAVISTISSCRYIRKNWLS